MPISSFQNRLYEWSQEHIDKIEPRAAIYEFYDTLEMTLFIGATKNVKESLQKHYDSGFEDNPCLRETTHFRVEYVDDPDKSLKHHITVFQTTSGGTLPECMQ